jgi:hypothetical protein
MSISNLVSRRLTIGNQIFHLTSLLISTVKIRAAFLRISDAQSYLLQQNSTCRVHEEYQTGTTAAEVHGTTPSSLSQLNELYATVVPLILHADVRTRTGQPDSFEARHYFFDMEQDKRSKEKTSNSQLQLVIR